MNNESEILRLRARIDDLERELGRVRTDLDRLSVGTSPNPRGAPQTPPVQPRAVPPAPAPKPRRSGVEFEQLLGGNILGKLGLVALILATGWFIKFAIDKRWLNESMRVLLALSGGFGIIAFGLRLAARRMRILPTAVIGAGGAIIYIGIFGAFYFYGLVGREEAFAGLMLLTAWLTVLSHRANSETLFGFSMAGVFLAPFLLSSGENSYRFLFTYLSVFNLAFWFISRDRAWRVVPFPMLFANLLVFAAWAYSNMARSDFLTPFLYLTLLYATFMHRQTALVGRLRPHAADDAILVILTQLLYVSTGFTLTNHHYPDWTAHFLLLTAAAPLLFHYLLDRVASAGQNSVAGFIKGVLLVCWTVSVFTALADFADGRLLTASWIALAGALSVFAARERAFFPLLLSMFLWLIALIRLFFFEGFVFDFSLVFNARFALYLEAALLLGLTYLAQRDAPWHKGMRAFAFTALGVLVIGSLFENRDLISDGHYRNLGYSYVLAGYAVALIVIGFARNLFTARMGGITLACLVVLKLYVYDIWTMSTLVRIIAGFSLGALLLVVSMLYQKYRSRSEDA